MGMFDYIRFEQSIFGNPIDTEYQTKSFQCLFDQYIVNIKGEIYKEHWDTEYVNEPESFFGFVLKKIPGTYRREYLTDYHGDIIFDDDSQTYVARFTHGRLEKITFKSRERMNESVLHEHTAIRESNSSSRSEERKETT